MKNNIIGTKYGVVTSNRFNKQLKKIIKQGKKVEKLSEVVKKIANKETLDIKYRDHALQDTKYYRNCRECHIEPDWLLIWEQYEEELLMLMINTGSHSDLFGKK